MFRSSTWRSCLAYPILLCLATTAAPSAAQIPDEFENLKLFEPDIEKRMLVTAMRSWAQALGVRCNHCHVGPENLQDMDFASDEKATKRTARRMLEMTRKINGELLAELPTVAEAGREEHRMVTCKSCHRGAARPPLPIGVELERTLRDGGAEAALARFRELREVESDSGRYDLRRGALFSFARELLEKGELEPAQAVVDGLLEMHPDLADAWVLSAQVSGTAGHLDAADAALARALELEPENGFAAWLAPQLEAARERARGDADGR